MKEKDFIYIKKDLQIKKYLIKKNEIGIVEKISLPNVTVQFVNTPYQIVLSKDDVDVFDPIKTGDKYNKKICNRCNRLLPVNNFQKNQNGKNNRTVRRPSCNNCRKEIDGVEVSTKDKREWAKSKPSFQIWECPICKKKTIPGLTSKVVLDHDHKTGKPRAWICDSCNTGLGRFKDDIETIESAITYLKNIKND